MLKYARQGSSLLCLAAALAAPFALAPGLARADGATPSPVAVTPAPTDLPTDLPPTAVPIATEPPQTPVVVAPEQSTPMVATPIVGLHELPPAPTAPPSEDVTPTPASTTTTTMESTTSTSSGSLQPVSPVPMEAPILSPAQLEMDARLRWGDRVPPQVRRWAFIIVPAAHRYDLDPNLIAAVMTMESNGDPLAWNGQSDARGLMQVLHGPWDPKANVFLGAQMIARFVGEFQDLTLALAAYNAGPNAVLSYGGVPPYRETRDYVIVVRYLFDLYSHRQLTIHRIVQYRSTLSDLQGFASQRKKVKALALIAHLTTILALECHHSAWVCSQDSSSSSDGSDVAAVDPFWPLGGQPDPLQPVLPQSTTR